MMLGRLYIVCVLCVLARSDEGAPKTYSIYQTAERIKADGYAAETHNVTTSDGYILEMHRIPYRDAQDTILHRPVVFLMHGLMSASNAFIGLGPDHSLAYNLVDAGFDVWIGNARGNKMSRRHVSLDPNDEMEKFLFFDFSFEEIGMLDLPAMIDYALNHTGSNKLHYIGHSQGGTVFLVLTSMVPEYNEKIASAHLLAGVGYQQYLPDRELYISALDTDNIYSTALQNGIVELYPPNSTVMVPGGILDGLPWSYNTYDYCVGDLKMKHMCDLIGVRRFMRNVSPEDHAGAALKQIVHYGQNIRDKLFRRFKYDANENMAKYDGATEPPLYNLSLITTSVVMHYTVNDNLLDERDVLDMVADMPNTIARKVARESFLHGDFTAALDAKELVNDFIIESINNASQNANEEAIDIDVPLVEELSSGSATIFSAVLQSHLIVLGFYVILK